MHPPNNFYIFQFIRLAALENWDDTKMVGVVDNLDGLDNDNKECLKTFWSNERLKVLFFVLDD
jgi:hypothetical protein